MSTVIPKPWGKELVLTAPGLPYTGKILYITRDNRLSLQYHDSKTETLTLLSGQAQISLGPDKDHLTIKDMVPLDSITILPGQLHRLSAVTDSQIIEVSSPEQGTTFRLEDDYGRSNEVK